MERTLCCDHVNGEAIDWQKLLFKPLDGIVVCHCWESLHGRRVDDATRYEGRATRRTRLRGTWLVRTYRPGRCVSVRVECPLSMFTIFRMEMRLDKDTDGLFTKFQKGINLLRNDERLFQGSLYMSIKDVNPNDRAGVLSEFNRKIQSIVAANREQNFLTDMYSGELGINCSPPLGTFGYYESLRHARQLVRDVIDGQRESPNGFASGSSFHDCIRLVLAKISILDWNAVDESSQRLQMNDLYRKLPGALRTGCLLPMDAETKDWNMVQTFMEPLLKDEDELAKLSLEFLSLEYPTFADCWAKANQEVSLDDWLDEDVDFGPALCVQGKSDLNHVYLTLLGMFQRYLVLISKGVLEKITPIDYQAFDAILSFLVCRRKKKVLLWAEGFLGTERFQFERTQIEQLYLSRFEVLLKRCLHKCAECQLQCMRSACHSLDEEHDCGMTHDCRSLCEYCIQSCKAGKEIPTCVIEAGHEGKCNCGKGDHTCGAPCSLTDASNCGKICVLLGGHDGDHRCAVKQHTCGVACSATNCSSICILNAEHQHTVHKCAETQCKHPCQMDNCNERCSTVNHFHDQPKLWAVFAAENGQLGDGSAEVTSTLSVRHICSSRHKCDAVCEAEGICNRAVEVSNRPLPGACGTFSYEFKEMVTSRGKCAIMLEPGQASHEGRHSCVKMMPDGTVTGHTCDVRCAACSYYCGKSYGHDESHSTAHGNMENMHFVAQTDDVLEWQGRKYQAGEKGIAEMCNLYCSSAGRGHVHCMKCKKKTAASCVYAGDILDQRRHCQTELKPRPDCEVDEVLHDKYWQTIGWEDPCGSAAERALLCTVRGPVRRTG